MVNNLEPGGIGDVPQTATEMQRAHTLGSIRALGVWASETSITDADILEAIYHEGQMIAQRIDMFDPEFRELCTESLRSYYDDNDGGLDAQLENEDFDPMTTWIELYIDKSLGIGAEQMSHQFTFRQEEDPAAALLALANWVVLNR